MTSLSKAVGRATDPKLRTDNWQYIIDVCDIVKLDPEDNGKEVMSLIETRLRQNDANVILRSLSLILSLAENCGSRLQQEVSSKHFTELLYSLVESNSVHISVKREVARVVKQLSKSFRDDPSLIAMTQLKRKIKQNYSYLYDRPDKPRKDALSTDARERENWELEEALRLSLQEYESQQQQQQQQQQQSPVVSSTQQQQEQQIQQQPGMGAAPEAATTVRRVRALYDLATEEPDELSFRKGDVIVVLEQVYRDWWRGSLKGKIGIFPLNYVVPIAEPTERERQLERDEELVVLSQKQSVDELHYMLKVAASSSGNGNMTDITRDKKLTELYSSVTPLRPQITKLIGNTAREKEDLVSIRQVLANAEQTYNQLLDQAANAYRTSTAQQINFPQPPSLGIQYQQQSFVPYTGQTTLQQTPSQYTNYQNTGQSTVSYSNTNSTGPAAGSQILNKTQSDTAYQRPPQLQSSVQSPMPPGNTYQYAPYVMNGQPSANSTGNSGR